MPRGFRRLYGPELTREQSERLRSVLPTLQADVPPDATVGFDDVTDTPPEN